MGQQLNKVIKRRRRIAYLERLKLRAAEAAVAGRLSFKKNRKPEGDTAAASETKPKAAPKKKAAAKPKAPKAEAAPKAEVAPKEAATSAAE